jgi:hypothetical protein
MSDSISSSASSVQSSLHRGRFDVLKPVRQWVDNFKVQNPVMARWIAQLIPAQCPFERDVTVLGHTVAHIPPLCKLNPLYDEVVGLRFRALCFLADECGEDITAFI